MDTISPLTISKASTLLKRGEITPLEILETCLQQISRLNPKINAFINITDVEAKNTAIKMSPPLDKTQPSELLLYGIPIGIKDLFDAAGIPTTAGTKFLAGNTPTTDAVVVARLRESGAVLIGKLNMHEIALGVTNVNPHYGTCCNPWDTKRIPGGSSGGPAAAVITGMCLGALGTDTGGSIRIPASLCGTVGLKPTYGRASLRGVIPLSWNLDHVGPITRTVRDAAMLLQVIAGYDPFDPVSINVPVEDYLTSIEDGIQGWHIALLTGDCIAESDPEVLNAIHTAAQVFDRLGAQIEESDLPWLRDAAQANSVIAKADAAAYYHERLETSPNYFGSDVLYRLREGAAHTSTEYALARRKQVELRRQFEHLFSNYDILLLPTTPIPAPLITDADAIEQARRLTIFTAPFNLAGLPALSLPCGFTTGGLPIGLQIVSHPWSETKLFRAGHAYEGTTRWSARASTFYK
ncbi:MAG: amidase [Anaerolineales bacterium]|nr:amidase [Anaerolineales bacterium]